MSTNSENEEEDECDCCDLMGESILKCGRCASGRYVEYTMKEINKNLNNWAIIDKYYWKRHAKEFAEETLKN
ncbi:hypothetical protein F8M41_003081 [Gigaspora margarita]|uniref:Uncharacterized protein n=1 Tax=Gigaspora margarita TaxID=4874 RepID=A0A8H4A7S1_GIGMA|nr:hypothetical protein F8M41_003081 [Gigaspora margarita]